MQREKLNKQNKTGKEKKEGYVVVPNYFLREWVKVLGVGPALLYLQLLSYCHKEKDIAWPTINSLCQQMGIAKTTLFRYQNTLIKFGLVKNISRAKSTTGHYRNNIYQITPLEKVPGYRDIRYQNDTDIGSKTIPNRFQNDTCIGSNLKLSLVSKRYPNNTNLKHYQYNNNKEGEDATVVAVNFKKLKEKGDLSACGHAQAEEKMRAPYSSKEHYTGQAVRERMVKLDFKEGFIEKILKEYSTKKIEEKLDLLMERRNIQSPAGWLRAALKNDYQGEGEDNPLPSRGRKKKMDSRLRLPVHVCTQTGGNDIKESGNKIIPNVIANDRRECGNPKHVNLNSQIPSPPEGESDKILSTEEARRRFHLLREKLMAMK